MKKILYLILIFVLVLVLTEFNNELMLILYSKSDSASYLTEIVQPKTYVSILLVILNIVIIWKYQNIKVVLILFLFSIITILLLNRIVAVRIYPTCEITTGWFLFRTQMIDISNNELNETSYNKLPFWRIRIKNKDIDVIIFAGPFQEDETLDLLKNNHINEIPADAQLYHVPY